MNLARLLNTKSHGDVTLKLPTTTESWEVVPTFNGNFTYFLSREIATSMDKSLNGVMENNTTTDYNVMNHEVTLQGSTDMPINETGHQGRKRQKSLEQHRTPKKGINMK